MKKGLLTIAAGLLIGSSVSAQYVAENWVVEDSTTNVTSLTGITDVNGIGVDNGVYTSSWKDGVITLSVNWEPTKDETTFYKGFSLSTIKFKEVTKKKFTKDAAGVDQESDAARGYSVDFTEAANRVISVDVLSTDAENLTLRMDVGDINGKLSNNANPKADIEKSADWQTVTYSWGGAATTATAVIDGMADMYSGDWWTITPKRDATATPLDAKRITKISFTINDAATTANKNTIQLKNIQIGAAANPTTFKAWQDNTDISTVSGATLEVVDGVIYSKGAIKVTNAAGQVVKVANGQVAIASLPAGILTISAAEGSAKIVK